MTLMEFIPVPSLVTPPDAPAHMAILRPVHTILAIDKPNANGSVALFRTMSLAERWGCDKIGSLLVCDSARPARSVTGVNTLAADEQCLFGLFAGNANASSSICPATISAPIDDIIHADDSVFVATAATPDVLAMECEDGLFHRSALPAGATRVELPPGCSAHTRAGIFNAAAHSPATSALHIVALTDADTLRRRMEPLTAGLPTLLDSQPRPHLNSDFDDLHALIRQHSASRWTNIGFIVLTTICAILLLCVGVTMISSWSVCVDCFRHCVSSTPRSYDVRYQDTSSSEDDDLSRPIDPNQLYEALKKPEATTSPSRRRK